jgi:hypothetical protein
VLLPLNASRAAIARSIRPFSPRKSLISFVVFIFRSFLYCETRYIADNMENQPENAQGAGIVLWKNLAGRRMILVSAQVCWFKLRRRHPQQAGRFELAKLLTSGTIQAIQSLTLFPRQ